MSGTRKSPEQCLLEIGTLVLFRVVDAHTELSPDKVNIFFRADPVFDGVPSGFCSLWQPSRFKMRDPRDI